MDEKQYIAALLKWISSLNHRAKDYLNDGPTSYSDFMKDYDDYKITILRFAINDAKIMSFVKQYPAHLNNNNIMFVCAAFYIALVFLLLPYFMFLLPIGVLIYLAIRYSVFYSRKVKVQKIIAINEEIHSLLFAYHNG